MSRPRNNRIINQPPIYREFKPSGVKGYKLGTEILTIDEFEAIRLADGLQLSHEEAALQMQISRPTFTRLIEKARQKTANFLINGKILLISGGNIHFKHNRIHCEHCKNDFVTDIEEEMETCPHCHSENLSNKAHEWGHGDCCKKKDN